MTTWDTAPASSDPYNPNDFYTSGVDHRGHSSTQRVSLPPDLAGQLAALVASRKFPHYDTVQALIRDAVVHRLKHLETIEVLPPQLQAILELRIARERAEALRERIEGQQAAVNTCIAAIKAAKASNAGVEEAKAAAGAVLPYVQGAMRDELEKALRD